MSLISGLFSLLLSGFSCYTLRDWDYLKRIVVILSLTLLIITDAFTIYAYNTGIFIEDAWYHELAAIVIPCLVISQPLFIHTLVEFKYSKIINKVFVFLGIFCLILIILDEIFFPEHVLSLFFIILGIILFVTLLYSSIIAIIGNKENSKRKGNLAITLGIFGLFFLPAIVFIDVFEIFHIDLAPGMPLVLLFAPLYYLIVNIIFIIYDLIVLGQSIHSPNLQNIPNNFIKKYNFSSREQEVFILLVNGRKYKEIAESLYISKSTVKTHINNIYKKCSVSSKVKLINLVFSK